jgi:hypothetical protein
MAESGVLYTCPDDFPGRIPSLMERAGIAVEPLAVPDHGEGRERGFAFQLSRDRGTVALSGFYDPSQGRFILGLGWGPNPFRWFRDGKLAPLVKELLTRAGMTRYPSEPGEGQERGSSRL